MTSRRWSLRNLMLLVAVAAVDLAVVAQASRMSTTIEFTLFITAVVITLNLFLASFLQAADRMNAVPAERQTEMVITLGCLLLVIMALTIPVILVILIRAGG